MALSPVADPRLERLVIYYQPGHDNELVPVTFHKSDAGFYIREEADAWWAEKHSNFLSLPTSRKWLMSDNVALIADWSE